MKKYGYRGMRVPLIGDSSGRGSNDLSVITVVSSGDVDNPVVGDVWLPEIEYVSTTGNLRDSANTTYVYKRDGVPISLHSSAKGYIIQQADVGSKITVEVTVAEQGGYTQTKKSYTSANNATGSGWCLGDIQETWEGLWDMSEKAFPKIQLYDEVDGVEIARIKCLLGNGMDWKPEQDGHNFKWDATTMGVGALNANSRGSLYKPPSANPWSEGTMFWKFLIPAGLATTTYFQRFFGSSGANFLYDPNATRYRIELAGLRMDFSAQPGDMVVVMMRWSDTPFTTLEPVAGQKIECYAWSEYGGAPKYSHQDLTTNGFSTLVPDYGHGGATTKLWPGLLTMYQMGWAMHWADDTEFSTIMEGLKSL